MEEPRVSYPVSSIYKVTLKMLYFDSQPFFPEILSSNEGNVQRVSLNETPINTKPILWTLDLGLFSRLGFPLSDKAQFDKLENQLLDFCQSILPSWRDQTLGVQLFSGTLEEILDFPWDQEQHVNFDQWKKQTSDAVVLDKERSRHYAIAVLNDFLELLTSSVSDNLEWFVQIECPQISDDLEFYQLANPARHEHLHIFWKCPAAELSATLVWERGIPLLGYAGSTKMNRIPPEEISIAWCLPPAWEIAPQEWACQRKMYRWLNENKILQRPIPQENISLHWQGLDFLFVASHQISPQSRRQLAGFCAAGGQVVTLGPFLQLANEITFEEFVANYGKA